MQLGTLLALEASFEGLSYSSPYFWMDLIQVLSWVFPSTLQKSGVLVICCAAETGISPNLYQQLTLRQLASASKTGSPVVEHLAFIFP